MFGEGQENMTPLCDCCVNDATIAVCTDWFFIYITILLVLLPTILLYRYVKKRM